MCQVSMAHPESIQTQNKYIYEERNKHKLDLLLFVWAEFVLSVETAVWSLRDVNVSMFWVIQSFFQLESLS